MDDAQVVSLLAGAAGLLVGSFLNVCIYRLPRDLSVVRPRSFCPGCQAAIAWYDNIPLLSFLILRGRCRRCRMRIPWRYPLVEALLAALFVLIVQAHGVSLGALKAAVFATLLVGLTFTDLEQRILPDEMTLTGAAAALLFAWWLPLPPLFGYLLFRGFGEAARSLAEALIAMLLCAGLLWVVGALYHRLRGQEGLGLGDVKMMGMIGAFLGVEGALLTLLVGSLAGSVIGLAFIWFARKDVRTYFLPFGTFLGLGGLAVLIAGEWPLLAAGALWR